MAYRFIQKSLPSLFIFFLLPLQISFATDVNQILDRVDKLYRSNTSTAQMEMEIITPNWQRKLLMDVATQGLDYTFVTVLSPKKDKGVSSLKRKKEMWNFFPKINKVIKIPPSMMMGSWMGSDFTNDDLVKDSTLRDDYISSLDEDTKSKNYKITLKPKKGVASVWGAIILFVNKKSALPVSQEFYDEKGKKIRSLNFKNISQVGSRSIPLTMELVPHTKEGHKTIVRYKNLNFDIVLPKNTFTRQNLQKRR